MAIDRIDWHWDEVTDAVSDEEHWEKAGAHIGYYMEWAYKKGFAPNNPEENDIEEYQKVLNSEVTGIEFLMNNCDCKFWDSDLNEEGQKFTSYAYDTYVNNLESILGHKMYIEKYNMQDFQKVSNYLDNVYEEYIKNPQPKVINSQINNRPSNVANILSLILSIITLIAIVGFIIYKIMDAFL
ncbi:MAG: hypothetical protein IKE91_06755 [Clostridia bacterium]|nr:hypothetical protein [Clostridia bacterium]